MNTFSKNGSLADFQEFIRSKKVVTELKPLKKFYPAEEYHRNYYQNNASEPYCEIIINPKLKKLKERYDYLLK